MIDVRPIIEQAQRLLDFAEHNDTVALDHELGELAILIDNARSAIDDIWRAARQRSAEPVLATLEDLA